jgi:hypothetical protein
MALQDLADHRAVPCEPMCTTYRCALAFFFCALFSFFCAVDTHRVFAGLPWQCDDALQNGFNVHASSSMTRVSG